MNPEGPEISLHRPGAYAEPQRPLGSSHAHPRLRADYLSYDTGYQAAAIDPRLAARLGGESTLKGSVGRFSAFPTRQVSTEGTETPSSPRLVAASSLGLERPIGPVAGRIQRLHGLRDSWWAERIGFFASGPPCRPPSGSTPTTGWGVSWVSRRCCASTPAAVGLLTMTLSRSERQDRPDEPVELFYYDQPLVLNASESARKNRRLGARVRYGSGNPTSVVNRFYDPTTDLRASLWGALQRSTSPSTVWIFAMTRPTPTTAGVWRPT